MSELVASPTHLNVADWNPTEVTLKPYKKNKSNAGGTVSIFSSQINKLLRIETPLMMTWGIADYVDSATGESDGKFTMTLNFPGDEYKTENTDILLEKLKSFEDNILDLGVENSEGWFGKKKSKEVLADSFSSIIKYPKNDRPPSLRVKVPCYEGKWGDVSLFDYSSQERLYPCEDDSLTPPDFVPKLSQIACVIQCSGLWFVGGRWGVKWVLNQAVVKKRNGSGFQNDVCHIKLSETDKKIMDNIQVSEEDDDSTSAPVVSTEAADSDEEEVVEKPVEVKKKKVVKKKVVSAE